MKKGISLEKLKLILPRQELKKLLEVKTTVSICQKYDISRGFLYKLRKEYGLPIKGRS